MKTQNFFVSALFLISSFLLLAPPLHAQISKAEKLYEEGVYQLEANGNFEEAIAIFDRIVKEFANDKTVAANALLKLGLCYERQGSQKAEDAYTRIIEEFPDQSPQVAQARERLAALRQQYNEAGQTMKMVLKMAIHFRVTEPEWLSLIIL
jgi:tetratricopeptide (TPR) repeat protein